MNESIRYNIILKLFKWSAYLLLIVFSTNAFAQTFQVQMSGFSGAAGYSPYSYTAFTPLGNYNYTNSNFTVPAVPTSFSIEFRNGAASCTIFGTVSNPSSYCTTGTGGGPTASCGGGGNTAAVNISVSPVLAIESGSSPPSDAYCKYDQITLVGSPGFVGYHWAYQIESGGWVEFNSGPGSSIAFTLEEALGANYEDHLNKAIFFSYSVGSCINGWGAASAGPFKFRPTPASIVASYSDPNCNTGRGTVTVISIGRDPKPDEVFDLKYRTTDLSDGGVLRASITMADLSSPLDFSGFDDGSYEVYVESLMLDKNVPPNWVSTGCGNLQTFAFTTIIPPAINVTGSSATSPTCHTSTMGVKNNGLISVTANGGTGSLSYSRDNWATSQTSGTFTGLTAGPTYVVMVKDAKGCDGPESHIPVLEPPDINVNTPTITTNFNGRHVRCAGDNSGGIAVVATSARTLSYSIDNSTYQASNAFNVGAGDYYIYVKDDPGPNGCVKISPLVSVAPTPAITGTASSTPPTCVGSSNGTILIENPAGGTGALEFSVNNGSSYQPGTLFTGRAAGNYSVVIRDVNACTKSFNQVVNPAVPITVSATPTLVSCPGGSDGTAVISTTNTVGTIQYTIGSVQQTSNTFTGLSTGTYGITVVDGNNCTGTGSVIINSNPTITGSIIIQTPISCNGGSNGALNLTPGGGVGPYTYTWSTGATTEDISAIGVGDYSVIVKDTKNCEQTFNRTITQPLPITINSTSSNFNGSNVSCFGGNNGSINITPAGGNGGYTYAWSNGALTQNVNTLVAGSYSVVVTDSKSCTGNKSVLLTQPTQVATTLSQQNVACFGGNTGSISVSTAGGTANYEYSINGGTNWQNTTVFNNLTATAYTVLTRDANSCPDSDNATLSSSSNIVLTVDNSTNTTCNQSNGSANVSATGGVSTYNFNWYNSSNTQIGSNNSINNLAAGIYHVVVTDQNNCTKQQNVTISSSNGPSVTTTNITAATCAETADGTATISITQGQTPYSIHWPNNQTTTTATNLAGGDYIVEVRDNTNCLALQTITVPAPPPLVLQTITQKDPNCNGSGDGQIQVQAAGGNGTYTYNWNTGATTQLITNLVSGNYTITVNDFKNCQKVQQYTLINPPVFTIDLGADQKVCEGQTVLKQAGVNNATYAWSGPNNFASTLQQVSLTQPGTYSLTATNQNGCKATDSFELTFDTNLLKADFLMVSQAFTGDTVIVIDISWPMPESVNWQFDASTIVIEQTPDYSLMRFDEPGTYTTTLQAQLAQCLSTYSHLITIVENPNPNSGGRKSESVINSFVVYPNPAMEKLVVKLDLNEQNQARVELFNLQSNQRALFELLEGSSSYETELKIDHLQPGLYVLVVKAGDEVKSVKVIKL